MDSSELFRLRTRRSMVTNPILIILGITGLVVVNDPSYGGFKKNLGANLFFGIGVVLLIAYTLYCWKLLKDSRQIERG
jgi:hypothetical protein